MIHIRPVLFVPVILVAVASCAHRTGSNAPQHPPQLSETATKDARSFYSHNVTVTWELRYYVVGDLPLLRADSLRFLKGPGPADTGRVAGFVMEVIEPPEYSGKVLTAHFDGAGFTDGFQFYTMGKRYTEEVPRSAIGQFHFGICR
jgi:hypothetical protein